jgi:hypothetical protein
MSFIYVINFAQAGIVQAGIDFFLKIPRIITQSMGERFRGDIPRNTIDNFTEK